jgi:hypothetical protein
VATTHRDPPRAPDWVCAIDETPASAALAAALVRVAPERGALRLSGHGERLHALTRVAQACTRRGTPAWVEGERLRVGEHQLALIREPSEASPGAAQISLREGRVEIERSGSRSRSEPAELLAAAPLLEAFERGAGLRWALVSVIAGRDPWSASVGLSERRPSKAFEAGLARSFPGMVGKLGYSEAVGPQLGSAIHMSVLLGAGATLDGVRDLLAAQAEHAGSRWPRLRTRGFGPGFDRATSSPGFGPGFGSADTLGDPALALDLDALTSAGPLIRITGYFDPPALLAGDLLRTLTT